MASSNSHSQASVTWDVITFFVGLVFLMAAPFTKVEESFNVQAAHDLLEYGVFNLDSFDHLQFPGVVPRTFFGALLISLPVSPIYSIYRHYFAFQPFIGIYLVRGMLLLYNTIAFGILRRALTNMFPHLTNLDKNFSLLLCTQFHLLFYASRPLPNTFAMAVCSIACAAFFHTSTSTSSSSSTSTRSHLPVWLLAFASIVFRCDVILLAAPLLLNQLIRRNIGFIQLIKHGVLASISSIAFTVCLDSYFWRRWLWPEGVVFWFNAVDNRSAEWGTSPWHWYMTSAMPRTLLPGACLVFMPAAVLLVVVVASSGDYATKNDAVAMRKKTDGDTKNDNQRIVDRVELGFDSKSVLLCLPAVVFVALYSFLPHKEVRFLFPSLPLFVALSAVGLCKIRIAASSSVSSIWRLASLGSTLALCTHVLMVVGFLAASALNYPGGQALRQFHQLSLPALSPTSSSSPSAATSPPLPLVHIGNLAAISGISRFCEQRDRFRYSKQEHLMPADLANSSFGFDFLIEEHCPSSSTSSISSSSQSPILGFELVHQVEGFHSLSRHYPFFVTQRVLCIYARIKSK